MAEKAKNSGRIVLIILLLLAVIVVGIGSAGFAFLADSKGWMRSNAEIVVEIPSGAGLNAISNILHENGVIKHPKYFRMIAGRDTSRIYQKGRHTLSAAMSYEEVLDKLVQPPDGGVSDVIKITIPEGFELRQIAEEVENKGLTSREKFMNEVEKGSFEYKYIHDIKRKENRLEGYLFPATYTFEKGTSVHDIVAAMLKKFNEVVPPLVERSGTELSLDEVVTLASVIEREAVDDSERGKVSSVFYNRMKKDMTLSSCATVQYVIGERKPILSNEDIKIDSKYNTYKYKGLPIGPIASPGEKSIEAALYPENTDYLYFAARMDGSGNVFTRTGEEHLNTVNELQNGGK